MEQQETYRRISGPTFLMMLITALFFDFGLQGMVSILHFIPAVGNAAASVVSGIISIFAGLTFFVWFKIRGVGILDRANAKKLFTKVGLPLIELTPLGFVPGWTLMIVFTFYIVRSEDTLKAKTGLDLERVYNIRKLATDYARGDIHPTQMLSQLRQMPNEERRVAREETARERRVQAHRRRKEMQPL